MINTKDQPTRQPCCTACCWVCADSGIHVIMKEVWQAPSVQSLAGHVQCVGRQHEAAVMVFYMYLLRA